jgi:hypothetical protein
VGSLVHRHTTESCIARRSTAQCLSYCLAALCCALSLGAATSDNKCDDTGHCSRFLQWFKFTVEARARVAAVLSNTVSDHDGEMTGLVGNGSSSSATCSDGISETVGDFGARVPVFQAHNTLCTMCAATYWCLDH